MYIGIAGKAMVSNIALACLGNWDVCPWTNSCMFRDPGAGCDFTIIGSYIQ